MNITGKLNEWLSIILKLGLIIVIALAVIWFGMSVYANLTESNLVDGVPELPDVSKAEFIVLLKATGEALLTDKYIGPIDGIYTLQGYYAVRDGRWQWYESDLVLDEFYFGKIAVERRQ